MDTPRNIGLRIAGTKQRQAGFTPLVSIGILAGDEGLGLYMGTSIPEKPTYVIKHAADYILYKIVDQQVKAFDVPTSGLLCVALTIPRGKRLAGDASPYSLLKEVYDTFVSTYMTRLADGRDSFKDEDCDSEVFRQIVSKYELEDYNGPYVAMNPQGAVGILSVPQDNLEDFFRNTQYKEFKDYKEIQVGVNCEKLASPGLANLHQPSYEVWVNGSPTGIKLERSADGHTAQAPGTKHYTYDSVAFTLGDLLKAPNNTIRQGGSTVRLDFDRERVDCSLEKKDIIYNVYIEWAGDVQEGKADIISLARNRKLLFTIDSHIVNNAVISGTPFPIKAADIDGKQVDVSKNSIDDYTLDVKNQLFNNDRRIVVTIKITKKHRPASVTSNRNTQGGRQGGGSGRNGSVVYETAQRGATNGGYASGSAQHPYDRGNEGFNKKTFLLGALAGFVVGVLITLLISMLVGNGKSEKDAEEPTPAFVDSLAQEKADSIAREQAELGNEEGGKAEDVTVEEPKTDQETDDVLDAEAKAAEAKKAAVQPTPAKAEPKKQQGDAQKKAIQEAYNNLLSNFILAKDRVKPKAWDELDAMKAKIPPVSKIKSVEEVYKYDGELNEFIKKNKKKTGN